MQELRSKEEDDLTLKPVYINMSFRKWRQEPAASKPEAGGSVDQF